MANLTRKKNILISTPNYFDTLTYLPYVHALLKTFCEKEPLVVENYEWFDPIFLNDTAENLLAGRETQIDILGLSCYLWNWPLQLEIAQRVRKANPNCLIIMGGPHPDWKDQQFFQKYPFVDLIVKNEGEQPFLKILIEFLKDNPDYGQIPSLILPAAEGKTQHTGAPLRLTNWDKESVWQSADMKKIATQYVGKTKLGVVWETNRGCPYHCSFCDWGSATYSKIRSLPEERLEEDLKFFAEYKVTKIFIADSNFGMFPRDLDLANRIVHYKEKFGHPALVHWSTAKNIAEPLIKIAKAFLDHGLDDSVVVSMQSTNENTVVEMGRGAHSLKTHKKFSGLIDELGAPKVGQIILGSPGESCSEFIDSLNEMIDLNFHRSLFLMNYAVLPNAPVTNPETMEKYQIKTISRPANRTWGHTSTLWKWKSGEETIIVGHNKMQAEDWVTMSLYKTHLMCMHHLGLTRLVSRVLKNIQGLSYGKFYRGLFDAAVNDPGFIGEQYTVVRDHFRDYLTNGEAIYALPGIDPDWYIDHESALFCKLITRKDDLFNWFDTQIKKICSENNIDAEFAAEALRYQSNVWITPDYDPTVGRKFSSQYDFASYFRELKDWDRADIKLEKKTTHYLINENQKDLKDSITYFDWRQNDVINLKRYQHRLIVGAYRRYMCIPLFDSPQIIA